MVAMGISIVVNLCKNASKYSLELILDKLTSVNLLPCKMLFRGIQ